MNEEVKHKPKFTYHALFSIAVTFIPILFPNIDTTIRMGVSIVFPISSIVIYFIKLELYARWADKSILKCNNAYTDLNEKHLRLKKTYKAIELLIGKHEKLSSRFIDQLNTFSLSSKAKEKQIIEQITNAYLRIKQDELGKYNRKDDLL